jgi:hypothetical protein
MIRFALPIATALLAGCLPVRPGVTYSMPLVEVRRPAHAAQRWGEYRIEPTDSTGYTYDDELLTVLVVPLRGTFAATIENKSDHSMQLLWSEAAYVGPDGSASAVTNGETRRIDVGREQPASMIPAHSTLAVVAIPNTHIQGTAPYTSIADFIPLDESATEMDQKEARLVLPIRVQDVTNEYTLVFRLEDVLLPPKSDRCSWQGYRNGMCRE